MEDKINAEISDEICPKCGEKMALTKEYDGAGHRAYICPFCKLSKLSNN